MVVHKPDSPYDETSYCKSVTIYGDSSSEAMEITCSNMHKFDVAQARRPGDRAEIIPETCLCSKTHWFWGWFCSWTCYCEGDYEYDDGKCRDTIRYVGEACWDNG